MKSMNLSLLALVTLFAVGTAKADYSCTGPEGSNLSLNLVFLEKVETFIPSTAAEVVLNEGQSEQILTGKVKVIPTRVGVVNLFEGTSETGETAKLQVSEMHLFKPSHCTRAGCSGGLTTIKITGVLEYLGQKHALNCKNIL